MILSSIIDTFVRLFGHQPKIQAEVDNQSKCEVQSSAWHQISSAKRQTARIKSFWWTYVGAILAEALHQAEYSAPEQDAILRFFHDDIAERLGELPVDAPKHRQWKSFMTDDFTPIEISWSWGVNGVAPTIRYSVEIIGSAAGSAADPFNEKETTGMIARFKDTLYWTDWSWYTSLLDTYQHSDEDYKHCGHSNDSLEDAREVASPSTVFLAFEYPRDAKASAKAYFLPPSRTRDSTKINFASVGKLRISDSPPLAQCRSYQRLLAFLETDALGKEMTFLFFAVDAVSAPEKSRFKIYVRSPRTDLASVQHILSLGGAIPLLSGENNVLMTKLRALYHSVFDEQLLSHEPRRETEGMLYYFDCAPSLDLPQPKVYFPAKHYSASDEAAWRGLSTWLATEYDDPSSRTWRFRFENLLKKAAGNPGNDQGCGGQRSQRRVQTYISVGFRGSGQLNVTSYLSPAVYQPN